MYKTPQNTEKKAEDGKKDNRTHEPSWEKERANIINPETGISEAQSQAADAEKQKEASASK